MFQSRKVSPSEEGPPSAKLCVLAEAPAKVEIRMGQPLVGPSGEVFNDCLRAAGIARNQCYILNIWPYRVIKDKKTNDIYNEAGMMLWHHTKGITGLGLAEAQSCIKKIHDCEANIIVALGSPAFNLLRGEMKPIMKWRGSLLWSDTFERKYLPTIHPAATLHGTYIWRYFIQSDFAKLKGEMDHRELKLPERELIIAPTSLREVLGYMEQCYAEGLFATDLEVLNRQVNCFSLATSPISAMTIPMVGEDGQPYWPPYEEQQIWIAYAKLMSYPNVAKVGQNILGFDIPMLFMQNHIRTCGAIWDTMIAQHIMYPHFPKGLDFIASWHTREPYWKDEGKIWTKKGAASISWETFQRYCAKDSAVTLEAWFVLKDELDAGHYWPTYHMTAESDFADALTYMSTRGLRVNLEGIKSTNTDISQQIRSKLSQLAELAGREVNVSSTRDCARYFYDELGLKPYIGPTGSVTTDDKSMARIVRKANIGSREAKLVQEIRSLKKLKGTYLETELDQDGRLRCSWNPRGTWTGRLSSSKTIFGTGLDLQNLHPAYKKFIVTDMEHGK